MVLIQIKSGDRDSERIAPASTASTETWQLFMRGLEATIRWHVMRDERQQAEREERAKG